jgi:hypothetical protein
MTSELLNRLPPVEGRVVELVGSQEVEDIIKAVLDKHVETREQYDAICSSFYKRRLSDLYKGLFGFCKQELPYREESGKLQTVKTPAAMLALAKVWGNDCKHYAGFIGGVLDALNRNYDKGIDWCYRFCSYNIFKKAPGHVFVVVNPGTNEEIWIDPVLEEFNIRTPRPVYKTDKTVDMPLVSISGVDIKNPFAGESGYAVGNAQQVGQLLVSVSKGVATIPVVGWIGGAVTALAGTLLSVFGKRFEYTEGVRVLVEKYMFKVLGYDIHDPDKVDESLTQQAQAWFSLVLGVPIYDSWRVAALMGDPAAFPAPKPEYRRLSPFQSTNTWGFDLSDIPINMDEILEYKRIAEAYDSNPAAYARGIDESAAEFLRQVQSSSTDTDGTGEGITMQMAQRAAYIARNLFTNWNTDPGGWKNYTVAPDLIADDAAMADVRTDEEQAVLDYAKQTFNTTTMPTTDTTQTAVPTTANADGESIVPGLLGKNVLPLLLLGGGVIWAASSGKKKKVAGAEMGKVDNSTLLLAGAGIVAVLLLTSRRTATTLPATQQPYYPPAYQTAQYPYGQPQQQANFWSALPSILNTGASIFNKVWGDD